MAIVHSTDDNFQNDVTNAKGLVLVDFWAEWCGPCKMISPILDEIDTEMAQKVKIVKVNVDEHPTPPTEYGVRSIPTLMLFKDGKMIDSKVGVSPKSSLVEWIETNA